MKKVPGMLASAVIGAMYGPQLAGSMSRKLLDMASTMPVPERMPARIPAARKMAIWFNAVGAWAEMRRRWSCICG
ncbi:hypothetical protein D3C80_1566290 [compost metagenome]